jgi:hypothetical protein
MLNPRFFCLLLAPSYRLQEGVDVAPERQGRHKTNPLLLDWVLDVNGPDSILNNGSEKVWTTQAEHYHRVIGP